MPPGFMGKRLIHADLDVAAEDELAEVVFNEG
jgi:hypothetical protein